MWSPHYRKLVWPVISKKHNLKMVTHFYCANTKNFKYLLGVFSPCFLFSNYYTRHKFFFSFSFSRSSLSLYVIHQGWVTTMGWVREIKRVEGEVRVLGLMEEGDDGFGGSILTEEAAGLPPPMSSSAFFFVIYILQAILATIFFIATVQ